MRAMSGACAALVLAVACGGQSSSGNFTNNGKDAGTGAAGGVGGAGSGAGGSDLMAGGSAGFAAGGTGVGATGGAAGSANDGGEVDAAGCAGPIAGETALCVSVLPERIVAQDDPTLDKKGKYYLQIFDTPTPPDGATPLASRTLPLLAANEIAVDAIPTVRLAAVLPATVYVRAFFVDNAAALNQKPGSSLVYGTWLGGMDLTNGIQTNQPLLPVPLQLGAGNSVTIPLTALRKLTATIHASVTPIGDGQGPLAFLAVEDPNPGNKPPLFGYGAVTCGDVSASRSAVVTGFILAGGPHWVTASLKDVGGKGDFPPGSLASLTVTAGKAMIPKELVVGATDYAPSVNINLDYAVPWPADGGAIPPNSCADLAALADGGP